MKNKWGRILILAVIVFSVSTGCFVVYMLDRLSAKRFYQEMQTLSEPVASSEIESTVRTTETESSSVFPTEERLIRESTQETTEAESISEEDPYDFLPEIYFDLVRSQNPELAAWLYIPDTVINYPVVSTHEHPYSYYTSHLSNGEASSTGSIFLDHNADPDTSDNVVIYGHHMKLDLMFHSLERYRDQEFADTHRNFYLMTEQGVYEATVFAVIEVRRDSELVITSFDAMPRPEWLLRVASKSLVSVGAFPDEEDRIISLSTCTYTFDYARLMVIGTLKEIDVEGKVQMWYSEQ